MELQTRKSNQNEGRQAIGVFTVMLRYPDSITDGRVETFLESVRAVNPAQAVQAARDRLLAANGFDPASYPSKAFEVLAVFHGDIQDVYRPDADANALDSDDGDSPFSFKDRLFRSDHSEYSNFPCACKECAPTCPGSRETSPPQPQIRQESKGQSAEKAHRALLSKWNAVPLVPLGDATDGLYEQDSRRYRLAVAKRALLAAYDVADEDPEACVIDLLTELRHLCDELDLDFDQKLGSSYHHYSAEKGSLS